jgi:hypothetical protein
MQSIKRKLFDARFCPTFTDTRIRDYNKLTYFYYAESYVNFNELVTDLFKQYKVRIWMSAVNPASVVNPAGAMQIPPPSAIGPGAILNSQSTASHAVGPGFGSNNYRSNEQYGEWIVRASFICSTKYKDRTRSWQRLLRQLR